MRSASVDLPWSMWAMIEKLRMCAWSMGRYSVDGAPGPLRAGTSALALMVRRIANSTGTFEVQPRQRAGLRAGGLSRCRECHAAQARHTVLGRK